MNASCVDLLLSRGLKRNIAIFLYLGRINININNVILKYSLPEKMFTPVSLDYEDLMLNNKNIDLSIGFDYFGT